MIVLVEDTILVNLQAKKYLELATFGLLCLKIHTIMLKCVMLAKDMLGMILEYTCQYIFPCHLFILRNERLII